MAVLYACRGLLGSGVAAAAVVTLDGFCEIDCVAGHVQGQEFGITLRW